MKKAVKVILYGAVSLWHCLCSLISPAWLGITYMNITGHGKGYSYDLGADKPFFILFGWIMLTVWIGACVPGFILLTRKASKWNPKLTLLPLVIFLLGFAIGVLIQGPDKFLSLFGL